MHRGSPRVGWGWPRGEHPCLSGADDVPPPSARGVVPRHEPRRRPLPRAAAVRSHRRDGGGGDGVSMRHGGTGGGGSGNGGGSGCGVSGSAPPLPPRPVAPLYRYIGERRVAWRRIGGCALVRRTRYRRAADKTVPPAVAAAAPRVAFGAPPAVGPAPRSWWRPRLVAAAAVPSWRPPARGCL